MSIKVPSGAVNMGTPGIMCLPDFIRQTAVVKGKFYVTFPVICLYLLIKIDAVITDV